MKTLQHEAHPARAKTAPAPALVPKKKGTPVVGAFTAHELEVAEQLIHLSESSASSGTPCARSRRTPAGSGGSSSSRSTGAPPSLVAAPAILLDYCVDWEDDEEHEVAGTQRRVNRFRLMAEIYAATERIGGGRTGRKK